MSYTFTLGFGMFIGIVLIGITVQKSKFVFLGLHGGDGENGNIQKILKENKVKFNGSGFNTSQVCMDKYNTGEFIRNMKMKGLTIAPQKLVSIKNILKENSNMLWSSLLHDLQGKTLIVKPNSDGCSSGIAHLYSSLDLENYLKFLSKGEKIIPALTLKNQDNIIEMPTEKIEQILFEKFIETDKIQVKNGKLKYTRKTGFVEVTIGVLEKNKKIHSLNPSITIAEGEVLSLEEKFQGGTGVNITPPPKEIVSLKALNKAKDLIEKLTTKIGIQGYARIDAFMNVNTGELSVIEVNTLPGLTPSTVLYHQGLAEKPQIFPRQLLEKIIKNADY